MKKVQENIVDKKVNGFVIVYYTSMKTVGHG